MVPNLEDEEVTAGAWDPRPLVVRNDEPGFLDCHLHRYWASSWIVECDGAYHEHPYGEGVTSKENQIETRFVKQQAWNYTKEVGVTGS